MFCEVVQRYIGKSYVHATMLRQIHWSRFDPGHGQLSRSPSNSSSPPSDSSVNGSLGKSGEGKVLTRITDLNYGRGNGFLTAMTLGSMKRRCAPRKPQHSVRLPVIVHCLDNGWVKECGKEYLTRKTLSLALR